MAGNTVQTTLDLCVMANLLADLSDLEGAVVLITGHTGFKGNGFVISYTQFGVHVVGFALEMSLKVTSSPVFR